MINQHSWNMIRWLQESGMSLVTRDTVFQCFTLWHTALHTSRQSTKHSRTQPVSVPSNNTEKGKKQTYTTLQHGVAGNTPWHNTEQHMRGCKHKRIGRKNLEHEETVWQFGTLGLAWARAGLEGGCVQLCTLHSCAHSLTVGLKHSCAVLAVFSP